MKAFLTVSVNDGADWIVPLVFDKTLESVDDTGCDLVEKIEFDDAEVINELFDWSDATISANGVHRLFAIDDDIIGVASVGAIKQKLN